MVGDTAVARTNTAKRWPMVEEEGRLLEEVPTLLSIKSGDGLRYVAVYNQLPLEDMSGVARTFLQVQGDSECVMPP